MSTVFIWGVSKIKSVDTHNLPNHCASPLREYKKKKGVLDQQKGMFRKPDFLNRNDDYCGVSHMKVGRIVL